MTKCTPEFNAETKKLMAEHEDLKRISRGIDKGNFGEAIRAKAREFAADDKNSTQDVLDKTHEYINEYAPHTKREVADTISGYGKRKGETKDDLQQRANEINKELREAAKTEDIATGKRDPAAEKVATYNKTRKTALTRELKDINERIASGKYDKEPPKPVPKTQEVLDKEGEVEAARREIDRLRHSRELKNRTVGRKIADSAIGYINFSILSGYHILGKLLAYTGVELATKPLHGIVSEVYRHLPKTDRIFEKAPIAGGGFNPKAEGAVLKSIGDPGLYKAMKQRQTRGFSDWDAKYGDKADYEVTHPWLEFFGRLHNTIKTPTEYASMQKAKVLEDAAFVRAKMAEGIDHEEIMDQLNSPVVQNMNWAKAYISGKEAVLKGDNRVVSAYKNAIRTLEGTEGSSKDRIGRALSYFVRSQNPVVKIPANMINRTLDYAGGGLAKAAFAAKDIDKMSNAEAEYIANKLVHGTVGTMAMAAYWYYRHSMSGYYQEGDNKNPNFEEDTATIAGHKIPSAVFHHPLTNLGQLITTIGRIYDKTEGTPLEKATTGISKGSFDMVKQLPFMEWIQHQEDAFKNSKSISKFAGQEASTLIPGLVKDVAKDTDFNAKKRKTSSGLDVLKSNIPGARETLPRD